MAQINVHMITDRINEFNTNLASIENKINLIVDTAKDMVKDLNEAIRALDNSVANSPGDVNMDEINSLKAKATNTVVKECESMKKTFRVLLEVVIEGKTFTGKELEARRKLIENPSQLDGKELKKMLLEKPDIKRHLKPSDHPKYRELEQLIEDVKNGVQDGGDDLLVDEPVNQVVKCPITRMPIKEIARNSKCDHIYEKSAILAYIKSRPNKKCPYAGCVQTVQLA